MGFQVPIGRDLARVWSRPPVRSGRTNLLCHPHLFRHVSLGRLGAWWELSNWGVGLGPTPAALNATMALFAAPSLGPYGSKEARIEDGRSAWGVGAGAVARMRPVWLHTYAYVHTYACAPISQRIR